MSWISLQRDTWRYVQYEARPSERLDLRLVEPRTEGRRPVRGLLEEVARVVRGPMVRVLNTDSALRARRQWGVAARPVAFTLRVDDRELPDNCGPFNVRVEADRADVAAGEGLRTSLHVPAPTFAQIFVGEISVSEAVRLGQAKVEGDAEMLESIFEPASGFALLDEF